MSGPTSAPKINTSSLPSSLPTSSNKPLPPKIHQELTDALLEANSIPKLEAQLSQSLSESGWTSNLRTYITSLVRSGECSSRDEVLDKVMIAVREGLEEGNTKKVLVNGGQSENEASIAIPTEVVGEAIKLIRTTISEHANVRVDDVDD